MPLATAFMKQSSKNNEIIIKASGEYTTLQKNTLS
jgi:hypothetical protein